MTLSRNLLDNCRNLRAARSESGPAQGNPPTLWTNWCWPRGSVPDPLGQSGGPEGPAVKARGLLTSKERNCAYRPTHPKGPFCWSTGSYLGPQGQNLVHRVKLAFLGLPPALRHDGLSVSHPCLLVLSISSDPPVESN